MSVQNSFLIDKHWTFFLHTLIAYDLQVRVWHDLDPRSFVKITSRMSAKFVSGPYFFNFLSPSGPLNIAHSHLSFLILKKLCGKKFGSKNGLGIHKNLKHPMAMAAWHVDYGKSLPITVDVENIAVFLISLC